MTLLTVLPGTAPRSPYVSLRIFRIVAAVLCRTRLAIFLAGPQSVAKKIPRLFRGRHALNEFVSVFDVLLRRQVSYSIWGVAYMNPGSPEHRHNPNKSASFQEA